MHSGALWGRLPGRPRQGSVWRAVRGGKLFDGTWASNHHSSARYATTSSVSRDSATAPSTTASRASSLHDAFVSRFSAQILSSPHRDITHVPYGDWFALYVQARKHWHALDSAPARVTPASREGGNTEGSEDAEVLEAHVRHAKQGIDAMLLSSLFARHWTEVHTVTTSTPSSSPLSTYRWWWHHDSLFSAEAPASAPDRDAVPPPLELCTPGFLTEPLLGGNHVRLWMEGIRASAGVTDAAQDAAAVPTAIIPFSSLWVVKRSAYCRPSAADGSGVLGNSGAGSSGHETATFTLQERQARQALLQSVDQLLQLQREAVERHEDTLGFPADQLQRVCVLSPTQEWDLLCDLPRYRQALCRPARPASSADMSVLEGSEAASISPPRWLLLSCLCEDTSTRLAYYAHTLSWRRQLRSSANAPAIEAAPFAVRVLSPASEHARFRNLSLFSLHEQSFMKAPLQRRHVARHRSSSSVVSGASAAATVHEQARKGCSEAVRRMSRREENIRQSFWVR
ncbi:hypothetical protein LSCM1_02659 [Leishmania martiniquensis]|uniref:Uncharacterized protein n=1 Tax=Leishmania martiniquensis TaxID=1580590 RepID=A0A836GA19_9TRYP|nr:hypothetical protein LSCM1_02659 [Leishmania martiniquensis]